MKANLLKILNFYEKTTIIHLLNCSFYILCSTLVYFFKFYFFLNFNLLINKHFIINHIDYISFGILKNIHFSHFFKYMDYIFLIAIQLLFNFIYVTFELNLSFIRYCYYHMIFLKVYMIEHTFVNFEAILCMLLFLANYIIYL